MTVDDVPLFRREALEASGCSGFGEATLAQPLPLLVLAACAVAAAAAVVAFLVIGEHTRRSRVAGQLVPDLGLVTLVAPLAGVVVEPMPDEGTEVAEGEPLVVIATPRATLEDGDVTESLLRELEARRRSLAQDFDSRAELLRLEAEANERRLAAARHELEQVEAAIAVQKARVAIAEEVLGHFRELEDEQHVSRLQLSQREEESLEQVASLHALERQSAVARRDVEAMMQAREKLPSERAALAAQRTRELAALEQERLEIRAGGRVMVPAPVAGLVASRVIGRGQIVSAGQALLSLLPAGSTLQAQLLVPSRAAGFIDPGDAVTVRYQAYPHQKFGHHTGRVLRISRHALTARELSVLTGAPAAEPHYRVLVALPRQHVRAYGREEPLLPGMLIEADILGERRRLYEWLLEPLWSITGHPGAG